MIVEKSALKELTLILVERRGGEVPFADLHAEFEAWLKINGDLTRESLARWKAALAERN